LRIWRCSGHCSLPWCNLTGLSLHVEFSIGYSWACMSTSLLVCRQACNSNIQQLNIYELLAEFHIKQAQPRSGAVVNNTTLFLHVPGSNSYHGKLFLQYFVT
jgi:hypothetical protein